MSAYLTFFELEQSPFEGKAQSQVVLGTRALRDAFGAIREGLEEGASRICVSGGAGLGKTSLARALPKLLGDAARVANVIDPSVSWEDGRGSLARQWGIASGQLARGALIESRAERPLVVVIDQAERATEEFLDHLDVLLSYRTEDDEPVVQSVMLANLATREGDQPPALVWWLDRIQTLQLEFEPLPRDGVASYITKHLRRAGWRGDALFTEEAGFAVHGYTGGVPGEISALCERLLIEAAAREQSSIDADFVHAVCDPQPDDPGADVTEELLEAPDAGVEGVEEEAWTIPDEFEALMAEAEFAVAEGEAEGEGEGIAEPTPERHAAGIESGADEARADAPAAEATDTADEALRADEESEAANSLAAALEFFEAAAGSNESVVDPTDDEDRPVDPADVGYDATEDDVERGGVWSEAGDDVTDTIELSDAVPEPPVESDETDAAFVPEPASPLYELTDDADEDFAFDEFDAHTGLGWLGAFKKLAGVAVAAAIGGLALVTMGGDESGESDPLAGHATTGQSASATEPMPSFAEPAAGFVDPNDLESLPADVVEKFREVNEQIAETEAIFTDPAPATIAEATPEARTPPAAPRPAPAPVVDEPAPEPLTPDMTWDVQLADEVERSPRAPLALTPSDADAPAGAAPAAPAGPESPTDEERFW